MRPSAAETVFVGRAHPVVRSGDEPTDPAEVHEMTYLNLTGDDPPLAPPTPTPVLLARAVLLVLLLLGGMAVVALGIALAAR